MHNAQTPEWQELCSRLNENGIESLATPEKHWLAIRELIDASANGGLISYFYNPGADHLELCLLALDQLKAVAVKELLLRQCTFFGDHVPKGLDERNSIIDSWKDGEHDCELDEIDAEMMPLLEELDSALETYLRERGLLNKA